MVKNLLVESEVHGGLCAGTMGRWALPGPSARNLSQNKNTAHVFERVYFVCVVFVFLCVLFLFLFLLLLLLLCFFCFSFSFATWKVPCHTSFVSHRRCLRLHVYDGNNRGKNRSHVAYLL